MTAYSPTVANSVTTTARNVMIPLIRKVFPALLAQEIIGVQPMTDYPSLFKKKDTRVWSKKKYNFSRAKWYIAEFNEKDYFEVDQWCTERFGPHPKQPDAWSRWWHKYESSIHFRDEKDYVWFTLRWA